MRISNRLTALAFLLVVPSIMTAQETQGVILGTVRDAAGKPLPEARVHITSPTLLGERVLITDANGNFRQPLLPPADYTVTASKSGFVGTKAMFHLNAGDNKRQDLALKLIPKQGEAVVEVIASAAQVDKTETVTKTSMSAEDVENITGFGVAGSSMAYNVVGIAPGVVGDVQYASIRGGSQMDTQYVVNGVSSRDNVTAQARLGDYLLDDTIEDTAVIQSPLNARYGNTAGGMVSVVTKRGSNEWSGSLRVKLQDDAWVALPTSPNNRLGGPLFSPGLPVTDSLQRTYEVTVSGPIVKDHLTFMYATRMVPMSSQSAGTLSLPAGYLDQAYINGTTVQAYPYQQNTVESANQKVTFNQYSLFYQITPNHQIEYNYSEGRQITPDLQGNSGSTPDSTIPLSDTTNLCFYSIAYRGVISDNQLFEIRYGKNRADTTFLSGSAGAPIYVNSGANAATIGNGTPINYIDFWNNSFQDYLTNGGNSDPQADRRTTESFMANYNIQLNAHGAHSIDVGYEAQMPIWGTVSKDNSAPVQFYTVGREANGSYITFNPATTVLTGETVTLLNSAGTAPNTNIQNSNYSTYFGGYEWTAIPSMQVGSGFAQATIRNPTYSLYANDNWSISDHASLMYGLRWDDMELKDPTGTKSNACTLSPRLEFKWDLAGDQSRLFNVSYGQFRGLLNARMYRNNVQTRLGTFDFYAWNGAAITGAPTSGMYTVTQAQLLDPNNYYKTPYESLGSAGYNVDPNWKPELNTEYTMGYRRTYTSGGFWRTTLVFRNYTDLSYDVTDFTNHIITLTNDPQGKRQYKGLEFEWSAPLNEHLNFGGSMVISDTTGNTTFGDGTTFAGAVGNFANNGDMRVQMEKEGLTTNQFMPNGQLPISTNQVVHAWLSYHLEAGRAKSVVTLQGNWVSGQHSSLNTLENNPVYSDTNYNPAPGTDTPNGIPTNYTAFWNGRGNYTQPDQYWLNLNYAFDFKIKGPLRFFTQLSINNVLNHPYSVYTYYGTGGAASNSGQGYLPTAFTKYGSGYNGNALGTPYYPNMVGGTRTVNIDMGFKF